MRRFFITLAAVGALTVMPGMVDDALAHGGAYRGPAGEVPPDSREPSDPPPPSDPQPPTSPGGDTGGPTTGGDIGGGPTTGGGGDAPPTSGGGGGGAPPSAGGTSGPSTGGGGMGRLGGSNKGPGYEDWTFWWNFNKDEILGLKSAVKKLQAGQRSSSGNAGRFAKRGGSTSDAVVTATDAAIKRMIVPTLQEMLREDKLFFDIQSAAAIALAKIGDDSIVETLKAMARNESPGYHKVVQESAGLSFGLLQNDSEEIREFLIEIVRNKDLDGSYVRPFSAISLGLLGDANDSDGKVMEALLEIVARQEKGADIKPTALLALGLLGNDKAVPKLLHMLENEKADAAGAVALSDVEMAFVVQALGKIGEPGLDEPGKELAVVDALTRRLDSRKVNKTTKNVRRSAAIALGRLAVACQASDQSKILKTLKSVAVDKKGKTDSSERNFATIAVSRIGATADVPADVRTEAIDTLNWLMQKAKPAAISQPFAGLGLGLIARAERLEGKPAREDSIRKPLRDKYMEEKAGRPRGAYAIALGLAGDPLAVDELVKSLKDPGEDKKLRGYSAVALGLIGAPNAKAAIKDALTNENDRELRVQTAVAAGLMGDASVISELVGILESDSESQYILGSVALALGQIGDERAIDKLVTIAKDEKDAYPDLTRALATVALGQIGDRRDLPVLTRVARDFNYRAHVPALAELLTIL